MAGLDVVPIARSKGVDVVSAEGLDAALVGVEIIIDAATGPRRHARDAPRIPRTANVNGSNFVIDGGLIKTM